MRCQIRHEDDGVYQGSFLGMGFWHPMSGMPEQGICEFPDEESAEKWKRFLETETPEPEIYKGKLTIEPYDDGLAKTMRQEAIASGAIKEGVGA